MKKIIKACLLICLSMSIMSCSSNIDSTNSGTTTETTFNPPTWIIGTWSAGNDKIEFTSDNIIFTVFGATTNYKDLESTDPTITFTEQTSSTTKYVVLEEKSIGSYSETDTFELTSYATNSSNATLNWTVDAGISMTFPLTKE